MYMNRTYRNFLLGDESIDVANGEVRYEGIEIARELCLKNRKELIIKSNEGRENFAAVEGN